MSICESLEGFDPFVGEGAAAEVENISGSEILTDGNGIVYVTLPVGSGVVKTRGGTREQACRDALILRATVVDRFARFNQV